MSGPKTMRQAAASPSGLVATCFGVGLVPVMPGTLGSAVALPVGWLLLHLGTGPWGPIAASLAVFVLGVWAAGEVIRETGTEDPGPVVIDEVAGQLLAMALIPPALGAIAVAFLAFRLCDILKPWPASWADAKLNGGFGAMADDMLAGLYAMGLTWVILFAIDAAGT
jgi:phosphatidylglycerophosphatase A